MKSKSSLFRLIHRTANQTYFVFLSLSVSLCSFLSLSLSQQLLKRHPQNRLGSGEDDSAAIKKHAFFKHIDWPALLDLKVEPPYNVSVVSGWNSSETTNGGLDACVCV